MYEFTIKINEEKELKAVLNEPLFEQYRFASMELIKMPGYVDKLAAGSSLVQHCWKEGPEELKAGDESKDADIAKAYASLCMDVYNEIFTGFEINVKKK